MPSKVDKLAINNPLEDRRVKLLPEDKDTIRELFANGQGIRSLARQFNVSRRTIQFICHPDKLKKNLEDRMHRGGYKQYYDKDKHAQYTKRYRKHKEEIFL